MIRAAMVMLAAAALWGVAGGVVAGLAISGAAAASLVELSTGIALTLIGVVRGHRVLKVLRTLGWRLVWLGFIEAVNVLCYYLALQMAPVGPVMAVHLTAPVMLTVLSLMRRKTTLSPRLGASLAMVCAALVLIASGGPDERYPNALAGMLLSLVSAACLAVFVTAVSRTANAVPSTSGAGAQMLLSGLMLSPALVDVPGHRTDALWCLAIGVVLFAPACWLYWYAMRDLPPITAGTVLLAEPFFGTVAAFAVYALEPSLAHTVAAGLVLGATYLDLRPAPLERVATPTLGR